MTTCARVTQEPNSPACSHNGTYECGVCVCNDGYYGDRCQCDETSVDAETHHDACRMYVSADVFCLEVFLCTVSDLQLLYNFILLLDLLFFPHLLQDPSKVNFCDLLQHKLLQAGCHFYRQTSTSA